MINICAPMRPLHRILAVITLIAPAALAAGRPPETPLFFEPNKGQAPTGIDYVARASLTALLGSTGGRVAFDGARPTTSAVPFDPYPAASNYLSGSNPAHSVRNVPHYRRIRYESVYLGIDLLYYGGHETIEYDFLVAPCADELRIDTAGDLWIPRSGRSIHQKAFAYPDTTVGGRTPVAV